MATTRATSTSAAAVCSPSWNAPDYEIKTTYMVTVKADDSTYMATRDVTVMVTNVDELEMVSGMSRVSYEENDEDAVATYTASGAMADDAMWTLMGDDAGDFTIAGGMLKFMESPDYESPADADMDNTYMVTIKAEAGGETATHNVTVMVTNVDETGELALSAATPSVGAELTATLTDPDEVVLSSVSWQWASENPDDSYSDIPGATMAAYTPVEADGGKLLRVTATYTDGYDAGNVLPATSENPVTAGDPLLVRYDADNDRCIQLAEARVAVGDYFSPPKGSKLSLEDAREVVGLLFGCRNTPSQ